MGSDRSAPEVDKEIQKVLDDCEMLDSFKEIIDNYGKKEPKTPGEWLYCLEELEKDYKAESRTAKPRDVQANLDLADICGKTAAKLRHFGVTPEDPDDRIDDDEDEDAD